ncbi:hypothetical protein K0U07_00950 [bacterium]|nr:hypothetical protein [bacterium]
MSITKYIDQLLPATTAASLYTSRSALKEQESGKNPFTYLPTLIAEQMVLWKAIEISTNKKFFWIKISCIAGTSLVYVAATARVIAKENLSNSTDSALEVCIRKVHSLFVSYNQNQQTISRVTSFAAYLFLVRKRPIAASFGLAVLTLYEIRVHTDYIPDKVQRRFLAILTKVERVAFFFTLSGSKLFYVAILHINVFFPHTTLFLTGNRRRKLEGDIQHKKLVRQCLQTPNAPLQIQYDYVLKDPAAITVCSTTVPQSGAAIKKQIAALLEEIEKEEGERDFLTRLLPYLTDEDERVLLEEAWFRDPSSERLAQIAEELQGMYRTEQDAQALTIPEQERRRIPALQRRYDNALERWASPVVYPGSAEEYLDRRKRELLSSCTAPFYSVLDQLDAGTFRQGGTLDKEDMLQKITFLVQEAEMLLAYKETDQAHLLLLRTMENADFCAAAINYNISQQVALCDRFKPGRNTLTQRIYAILQRHRTNQIYKMNVAIAHRVASYFFQGDPLVQISHDNHVVQHLMGVEGIEENPHKDAQQKPLNLKRYAILKFWKVLLAGRETYHRFIHPDAIIDHVLEKIQENEELRENVNEWKAKFPTTGTKELRATIKLLLIDIGVLAPARSTLAGKIAHCTRYSPVFHTVARHFLFIPPVMR